MLKKFISFVAIALSIAATSCVPKNAPEEPAETRDFQAEALKLAKAMLIVDTHIDVPARLMFRYQDVSQPTGSGDFDYPRAVAGGLDAPFMSIFVSATHEEQGDAFEVAERLIDSVEAMVSASPEKFALATSPADLRANFAAGRMSLPMGIENGSPIDGDLANLTHFYHRGIRYITLSHFKSNHISDSSSDSNRQWHGLSDFGKRMVSEMNRLGIIIDVSHISDEAFYQVIEISRSPVIASHSSARSFTPGYERNMSDDMIVALAGQGGVIQINFGSHFLTPAARAWTEASSPVIAQYRTENGLSMFAKEAREFALAYREQHPYPFASLEDVLDHFDYVVQLVGIDHVGIGSDYDGVGNTLPVGLKDVSAYPNLIAGLLQRGYSETDIEKILSGNLLRVWSAVESYAQDHGG